MADAHSYLPNIEARTRTLLNDELKDVLRNEKMKVTGVKVTLQQRITEHAQDLASQNDIGRLRRLRYLVSHKGQAPPLDAAPTAVRQDVNMPPTLPGQCAPMAMNHAMPSLTDPSGHLAFTFSPFFRVQEDLTAVYHLQEYPKNRHAVKVPIQLSEATCARLKDDSSLRVMLYCAASSTLSPFETVNIAFPSNVEVKMNEEDIRSNFRGLKNKPGTTKPADLTAFVRKTAKYTNNLVVTYALTNKRYSVAVKLVKKITPAELTEQIRQERSITEQSVRQEMASKAQDDDIVTTSSIMSLKDPISAARIVIPCRSNRCQHTQCFDAQMFLELQEQAPTWVCPICSKTIRFTDLAVDQYFQQILDSTTSSTEQVTIEPTGDWHSKQVDSQTSANDHGGKNDDDSDEDVIDISASKNGIFRQPAIKSATPVLAQYTPPMSISRETSVSRRPGEAASNVTNGTKKRAIIDLTLSDDEGPRPTKRPVNGPGSSTGMSSASPGLAPVVERPSARTTPAPRPAFADRISSQTPGNSLGPSPIAGPSPRPLPYANPFSVFSPLKGHSTSRSTMVDEGQRRASGM